MYRYFLIFLGALSLFSCRSKDAPVPEYSMETIEVKDPRCKENDSLPRASINITFPVFKGTPACDQLNEGVKKLLLADLSSAEELVNTFFERYSVFKKEQDSIRLADKDKTFEGEESFNEDVPWQYGCGAWVNFISGQYICLQAVVSNSAVFSHLDTQTSYGTFDAQTGKRLSPENIFSDTLEIKKLLNEYFILENKLNIGISLADQGINLPEGGLPLSDDFSLTTSGVTFGYKTSNFAPNISLYQYVSIPISKIEHLLNDKPKY